MSILIKDMEMPEDCRDCPMEMFCINCGDTRCRVTNKLLAEDYRAIHFRGRPDWCPLVEVPAPHGRLIDADKLMRDISKYHVSDGMFQHWVDVQQTVIEAEEGEDE